MTDQTPDTIRALADEMREAATRPVSGLTLQHYADRLRALADQGQRESHIAAMDRRYIERLALCPDHRDKATGRCIVCQAEERTRQELRAERAGLVEERPGLYTQRESTSIFAAAPAPTGAPPDRPFCRKHRVLKVARAHYYCELCAEEGWNAVVPMNAPERTPDPATPAPTEGQRPAADDDPNAVVLALVADWRSRAEQRAAEARRFQCSPNTEYWTYTRCANELEAAIGAPLRPRERRPPRS